MLEVITKLYEDFNECVTENDELFFINFGNFNRKALEFVKE